MKFTFKIQAFVKKFIEDHQLISENGPIVVAVSGGVDSIVLLDILHHLYGNRVEVLHFNHGTRASNILDQRLVLDYANFYKIKFHLFKFQLSLEQNNFEKCARDERNKVYQNFILENKIIATAHHLNDSFEWSLMQRFKQANLKSALGIPVFNQGKIRPLLCLSKKQILMYAELMQLKWYEDSSNDDLRFERNYIRKIVIRNIEARYPNYLKHYVDQQNELAKKLEVHRMKSCSDLTCAEHFISGYVLKSEAFKDHKTKIKEIIYKLSAKNRGEIELELNKLVETQQKYINDKTKIKFYGPFSFSGNVKGILYKNTLHLFKGDEEKKLTKEFQLYFYSQIPCDLNNKIKKDNFPNLRILSNKKERGSKLIYPYLKEFILDLKSRDVSYNFDV